MGRRKTKFKVLEGVSVFAFGHKGHALGRAPSGEVVLIEGAAPGDVVTVRGYKKRKGMLVTRVDSFEQYSEHRVTPACEHFGICGGCKWQQVAYSEQLRQKQQIIENALFRIGKVDVQDLLPILGAEKRYHYRNKMEYSCSAQRWLTEEEIQSEDVIDRGYAIGFHRPGAWNKIVDIETCHLQESPSNEIKNFVRSYARLHEIPMYDVYKHEGVFRSVMIRRNRSGDVMCVIVAGVDHFDQKDSFLKKILDTFPSITSLYYVHNHKVNDSLYDLTFTLIAGTPHIIETLGDKKYVISPKSFFQTNSYQAGLLYDRVKYFANLKGHETVYDLYSGTGSIACYLADEAKEVIGIETIEDAIKDARINQSLNNIQNASWYVGDVKDVMNDELIAKHGHPDLIILDPPRAGVHEDALRYILSLKAEKIVYVSCNPATQARDLSILSDTYAFTISQGIDMFPHTDHIENIVCCVLKK